MLKIDELKNGQKVNLPARSGIKPRTVLIEKTGPQGVQVRNQVSGRATFIRNEIWDAQYAAGATRYREPVQPRAVQVAALPSTNGNSTTQSALEKRLANVERSLAIITEVLQRIADHSGDTGDLPQPTIQNSAQLNA